MNFIIFSYLLYCIKINIYNYMKTGSVFNPRSVLDLNYKISAMDAF